MRSRAPEGVGPAAPPSFWPIAVAAAYDSIGYAVVAPVLPALRVKAHATALAASAMFSGFSIGLVAGFALAGVTTKRLGPRFTLLAGVGLHVVADALLIRGHTASVYTAARVVQGVGSGGLWMGAVFGALGWWRERPERRLAGILAAYSVGAIGGPLLAGFGGTVRPFAADAVLAMVVLAGLTRLPAKGGHGFGWGLRALRDPRLAFAAAVVLFTAFFYATVEGSFTLRFAARLSQTALGVLVATVALAAGIGALLPAAARGPRLGRLVAQGGMLTCAALVVAATASTAPWAWFVFLPAAGMFIGAGEAGAMSVQASMPASGMITTMMAAAQGWALGFLVAPSGATWLSSTFGRLAPALGLVALAAAAAAFGLTVRAARGEATAGRSTGP
jgi:MFS transporter